MDIKEIKLTDIKAYENNPRLTGEAVDKVAASIKEFYKWVYTRDFPVYFSSYEISDNRFELLFAKRRMGTLSAINNADEKYERLWANRKGARLWQKYHSN